MKRFNYLYKTLPLIFSCIVAVCLPAAAYAGEQPSKNIGDTIPAMLRGNFEDDYEIRYSVSDTLWLQQPNVKYHIISWNLKEQYLIAKNDKGNPSETGLYTRIDYMTFANMKPFLWGFCLTTFNAVSIEEARTKSKSDRQNPKKGCNGYPFSRMKRVE